MSLHLTTQIRTPDFEGPFTGVPVQIYIAKVGTVPFDWDGNVRETYLEPVEGVVLCTGIVEEMADDDGIVEVWQGPVQSTCDEIWTTVAEGFASSDPPLTGHPPNTWVPMGLGVGIVKAPEQPGEYVLVVEPQDEAFRRGDSWKIDSTWLDDNFMKIDVGGGVYLDEEYERFGATIDVPEPRQVYVQAKLNSLEFTVTIDVEYTDPDGQTTQTATVTMNRMGTADGGKGQSVYLSEPFELVLEGEQNMAKVSPQFLVKVGGKLVSMYVDKKIAQATIENQGPVDLDIDGDNNNGSGLPDRSAREEDLETGGGYGKFVFVNHNDDDGDGIPDYADTYNSEEGNFVPIVLNIDIPNVVWPDVSLSFEFDGVVNFFNTTFEPIPDPRGITAFTGFFDHRSARRERSQEAGWNYPSIRLWTIGDPSQNRYPENFVIPGQTYSAADLGFGQEESPNQVFSMSKVLTREEGNSSRHTHDYSSRGDNGRAVLQRRRETDGRRGESRCEQRAMTYSMMNSLLSGVEDRGAGRRFPIDQYDEIVEDQNSGFEFWKRSNRNDYRPIDMFRVVIDVPSALSYSGMNLQLRVEGLDDTVIIVKNPSSISQLNQFLNDGITYEYVINEFRRQRCRCLVGSFLILNLDSGRVF